MTQTPKRVGQSTRQPSGQAPQSPLKRASKIIVASMALAAAGSYALTLLSSTSTTTTSTTSTGTTSPSSTTTTTNTLVAATTSLLSTVIAPNGQVAVPAANCGPGSVPETGLQGQVSLADRQSGRSQQGYSCNLQKVGQYQGEGASWVNQSASHCAYMATSFLGIPFKKRQGVQVVDVSDTANPKFSKNLTSAAFYVGPWESMKVNPAGTILAGAGVGPGLGIGTLDVYDITDCANPKLLNNMPFTTTVSQPNLNAAHEGEWSPDGKTYWVADFATGSVTAIDMSNPKLPRTIYFAGSTLLTNHGFSFSPDGNTMYLTSAVPAGMAVVDVSDIQNRRANPVARQISALYWTDGGVSQKTIPVNYSGKNYVIVFDEASQGGIRFIDISNPAKPQIASYIRLAIQLDVNNAIQKADTADNGMFGYDTHYCTVDQKVNPTALACGYFQSGIRVFNIVNPLQAKEIAYFNPPAKKNQNAALPGSEHANIPVATPIADYINPIKLLQSLPVNLSFKKGDMSADYCSSPPRFVNDQLWVTCQDNGFMTLKFANGVYPIK